MKLLLHLPLVKVKKQKWKNLVKKSTPKNKDRKEKKSESEQKK